MRGQTVQESSDRGWAAVSDRTTGGAGLNKAHGEDTKTSISEKQRFPLAILLLLFFSRHSDEEGEASCLHGEATPCSAVPRRGPSGADEGEPRT